MPWFARGLNYYLDPGVLAVQKCRINHRKEMDRILAELILAHGGTKTETCGSCGTAMTVMWFGPERWEMREFPPHLGAERKY